MSKKIDQRLPREVGENVLPMHAGVKSPWEKVISYHDAAQYCQRYNAVLSAAMMQALRILIPDYKERSAAICKNAYNRLKSVYDYMPGYLDMNRADLNMHPFMRGNFVGGLIGDKGDEELLMCGRVNDFGTYRAEKELDVCYWDIVGTELCRSTTQSLQACADCAATGSKKGPSIEYHMVEAKGAGDRHCRIVAESREKFPMPPHEQWECFGPVGSADQIKYTKEEDCIDEPMMFREETGYAFSNGTNKEEGWNSAYPMVTMSHGFSYVLPTFADLIREERLTEEQVLHTLHCVCEAAGKATFIDNFSKEGLRQYLGVPHSISCDDGRLVGAYIEMFLQCMRIPYNIEAFNKNECIYDIDSAVMAQHNTFGLVHSYKWFWYGITKCLVNAQWSLWDEDSAEGRLRIKIAKKVDKFC